MPISATQKRAFIGETRQLATETINLMHSLRAHIERYKAGGYDSVIDNQDLSDFGNTRAEFRAAIASFEALVAAFDQSHDSNLETFRS